MSGWRGTVVDWVTVATAFLGELCIHSHIALCEDCGVAVRRLSLRATACEFAGPRYAGGRSRPQGELAPLRTRPFDLTMRLYLPRPEAVNGQWSPQCVELGSASYLGYR